MNFYCDAGLDTRNSCRYTFTMKTIPVITEEEKKVEIEVRLAQRKPAGGDL